MRGPSGPAATILAALVLGVVLRLLHLLGMRSLWKDEISLVLNILGRSFTGLADSLDYRQMAPVPFLWMEKGMTLAFGDADIILRLLPFLFGVAALFVFARLAVRVVPGWPAALAVVWFALLDTQIYYSAEVKQYSLDVLVTCILLYLALSPDDCKRAKISIPLAIAGVIAPWVSFPSAFILFSIGSALVVAAALTRPRRITIGNALVTLLWAVSFMAEYLVLKLGSSPEAQWMRDVYWVRWFFRLPDEFPGNFFFFGERLFQVLGICRAGGFAVDAGLTTSQSGLAAFLAIVGLAGWWQRDRLTTSILAGTVIITFAASACGLYPIEMRLVLFLTPVLVLANLQGGAVLWAGLSGPARVAATVSVTALLALYPLQAVGMRWLEARDGAPFEREAPKALLAHIAHNRQPEDILYLYPPADRALKKYAVELGLVDMPVVLGGNRCATFPARLAEYQLLTQRGRLWVVMPRNDPCAGFTDRDVTLQAARATGSVGDVLLRRDSTTFLFNAR